MFGEDINSLIICSTIFKRENVLMNQLYQIVSMELNMLYLTVGKRIFSNLYGTLTITVDCSRGLNRKANLTQKLVDPYYFNTYLNNAMVFFYCNRQENYLLFECEGFHSSSYC